MLAQAAPGCSWQRRGHEPQIESGYPYSPLYVLFKWIPHSQWKCGETELCVDVSKTIQACISTRSKTNTRANWGGQPSNWQRPLNHLPTLCRGHVFQLSASQACSWLCQNIRRPEQKEQENIHNWPNHKEAGNKQSPVTQPLRLLPVPSLTPRIQYSLF